MDCSQAAPRLEGPPSSKNIFKIIDTGGGGVGGSNIRNEGPKILLAQGPLKA